MMKVRLVTLNLQGRFKVKIIDTVYYMIRTFVFYIHRDKQISLGRWPSSGAFQRKPNTKNTSNNNTNVVLFSAPSPISCSPDVRGFGVQEAALITSICASRGAKLSKVGQINVAH